MWKIKSPWQKKKICDSEIYYDMQFRLEVSSQPTTELLPPLSLRPALCLCVCLLWYSQEFLPLDRAQAVNFEPTAMQTLMAASSPVCATGAAADVPPADAARQHRPWSLWDTGGVPPSQPPPPSPRQFCREKYGCASQCSWMHPWQDLGHFNGAWKGLRRPFRVLGTFFCPHSFPSLHFTDIAETNTGINSCLLEGSWGLRRPASQQGVWSNRGKGSTATFKVQVGHLLLSLRVW